MAAEMFGARNVGSTDCPTPSLLFRGKCGAGRERRILLVMLAMRHITAPWFGWTQEKKL